MRQNLFRSFARPSKDGLSPRLSLMIQRFRPCEGCWLEEGLRRDGASWSPERCAANGRSFVFGTKAKGLSCKVRRGRTRPCTMCRVFESQRCVQPLALAQHQDMREVCPPWLKSAAFFSPSDGYLGRAEAEARAAYRLVRALAAGEKLLVQQCRHGSRLRQGQQASLPIVVLEAPYDGRCTRRWEKHVSSVL